MKRSAGILLPIFSLPSPYGIGTFGKSAYRFADFLNASGQSFWQVLPLGPSGPGNSPYQSCSSFAGDPLYIDLDMLIEDGLLTQDEVNAFDWGDFTDASGPFLPKLAPVDYDKVRSGREKLLHLAFERGFVRDQDRVSEFFASNSDWLSDYALFMAVKKHFSGKPWTEWPDPGIRHHDASSLEHYRELLSDDVDFFIYLQYLFYDQWCRLQSYVHEKGISFIGDLPIYTAMDSADVWANRGCFLVDEDGVPSAVGGVPPDYFSKDGQYWGNPLYDWDRLKADGYGFWLKRIDATGKLFDVIRIDHFRAFDEYWAIPYGSASAKSGSWKKGPGIDFLKIVTGWFPKLSFIAEDLGIIPDSVRKLVKESGFPGMKVLQFAFSSGPDNAYLPHNFGRHSVCYTGTHDNMTLSGWLLDADISEVAHALSYSGMELAFCESDRTRPSVEELSLCTYAVIRSGMASVSDLFVAQFQDYACLDNTYRTNVPGTMGENWRFRISDDLLSGVLSDRILRLTELYGRI